MLSVCLTKNVLKRHFAFDFVMIHVGMYTKCSEMFHFEKSLNFDKSVWCEKYFDRASN